MNKTRQKPRQFTTRPAACVTVAGHCTVLDPLVSKYAYFNPRDGHCEYEIKHVSAEAIHAARHMPKVIERVESVLSGESGNQLFSIFDSNDNARKRLKLLCVHSLDGSDRHQDLMAVRTDGSSCNRKSAIAFRALVDLYSRDDGSHCKEVRLMHSHAHAWVEVLTHAGERMVFEAWTLFPEVVAAEDGPLYDERASWVKEVWRPDMGRSEPWADFVKEAVEGGPVERAPSSMQAWVDAQHVDQGLQGYSRSSVEGLNVPLWNRAEACRTSQERESLNLPGHKRVVYQGPGGETYNGDLVRQSRIDWHRRTARAMRKVDFPERFEARELLRRDLQRGVQEGNSATVGSLLKASARLIMLGPDCSDVLDDALWAAVRSGCDARVEIADLLIRAGAKEEATRDGGQTLLMEAAALGDLAMVMSLLGQGLRSDQRNDRGNNAFQLACYFGHVAVVEHLKTAELLDAPDLHGRTPLMLARLGGRPDIVQALLLAGAKEGS